MKNNQRGITLVALVITIIVLLILAGVTVASLSGENGLLTRGSQAVNRSNVADAKEKVTLAFDNIMGEYYDAKYVTNTLKNQTAVAFVNAQMKEMIKAGQELEGVAKIGELSGAGATEKFTITLEGLQEENANQTENGKAITVDVVVSGNSAKFGKWSDSDNKN